MNKRAKPMGKQFQKRDDHFRVGLRFLPDQVQKTGKEEAT